MNKSSRAIKHAVCAFVRDNRLLSQNEQADRYFQAWDDKHNAHDFADGGHMPSVEINRLVSHDVIITIRAGPTQSILVRTTAKGACVTCPRTTLDYGRVQKTLVGICHPIGLIESFPNQYACVLRLFWLSLRRALT